MKLYRLRYSPYARKVQMVLDLLPLPYELVEVSYGQVRVRPRDAVAPPPEGPRAPVSIPGPGTYAWAGAGALVVRAGDPGAPTRAVEASFDADAIRWPLSVRARRPGDRMRPRGGRGSRKLSDLLIDAKIARDERARLPVLTTADGVVLYVPGLRPAEHGRPSASSRRLVTVTVADDLRQSP